MLQGENDTDGAKDPRDDSVVEELEPESVGMKVTKDALGREV